MKSVLSVLAAVCLAACASTQQPANAPNVESAYALRTSATPMNLKVPPNGTTSYTISVWANARGGYLASTEPVTIQGTAYFDLWPQSSR